jgi:pimeloyl-ACP methyl ester carboxylesterase
VHAAFTPSHRGGSGSPLLLVHGFTDTWRTWELVLPMLERHHDVLAPTLPGHAGGPPIEGAFDDDTVADALEQALDGAGFETAHIVGNSLGGYVALQLAARGRARSVVALAPAGGWAEDDDSYRETLEYFKVTQELLKEAAPHADAIAGTPEGRRQAMQYSVTNVDHLSADLVAHEIRGAANCDAAAEMIEHALNVGWSLDAARVECPLRIVWGTADQILPWPAAAARYLRDLPQADWVELPGIGHLPQLDVPLETAELVLGLTRG